MKSEPMFSGMNVTRRVAPAQVNSWKSGPAIQLLIIAGNAPSIV